MAKRRKSKRSIGKGKCIIINTPAGKRKLCKDMRGKVKFRKMSYSPR